MAIGRNLLGVRRLFKEFSGRLDLVNDLDDSDNGADDYINAGQRFLDRKYDTPKSLMRRVESLTAGQTMFSFEHCRAIAEVWLASSTEDRKELEKISLTEFRSKYPGLIDGITAASADRGDTEYWAETIVGLTPEQNVLNDDSFDLDNFDFDVDYFDILEGDHFNKRAILLGPPPDTAMTINVMMYGYSRWLENDTDFSFWTMEHPHLLAYAALYMLEKSYRNMSGAEEWLKHISVEGDSIDDDNVKDEMVGSIVMRG